VWSELAVIGRIQIQERACFRQYPALKGAAVDGSDSFLGSGSSSVGIKFDAGQVCARIFDDFD